MFRREPETRLFAVDYLAAERTGDASVGIDPVTGLPALTVGRSVSASEVSEALDDD